MDVHFGSENPIDIHILTEFEMDIHRMTLSGWGMDVYMGIWNGFEMNIPRMPLLGWPEEKFFRSVWKNGIWTHWKSVRKESSKFQELAFKGRILTWLILLTGNRTIGGVVPNSAFFFSPFWRRKFFSDYTFSKGKNWSMKYRFKNKRSREGYKYVISRLVSKLISR